MRVAHGYPLMSNGKCGHRLRMGFINRASRLYGGGKPMADEVSEGADQQPGAGKTGETAYMAAIVDLQAARESAQKKKRGWGDVDRLVEKFNQRYCVTNDGGVTVVFEER